jgi:Fe-S-cluster formation regulator IscX/YfhJ
MKVFGIGEKKTPVPFISACDKFIYLEILKSTPREVRKPIAPVKRRAPHKAGSVAAPPLADPVAAETAIPEAPPENENHETVSKIDSSLIKLMADSINDVADEDGWTFLGSLGSLLLKKQPDFDPRNYGFSKLVSMVKRIKEFEVDQRKTGKNNNTHVYVRVR